MKQKSTNTRKNTKKKEAKQGPEMFPEDVQAFLILLLSKVAMLEQKIYKRPMPAQITVKMDDLRRFRVIHSNDKTEAETHLSYDAENDTVTLRGPDVQLPEQIYTGPKKTIITEVN